MTGDDTTLGIQPLDTRSVILSALLGSHPPVLPASDLIALAELFGFRAGAVRTALSRMVSAGDLVADNASYRLTGRLLDRQHEQDSGRTVPDRWDHTWWSVVVESDRRSSTDRRTFRSLMQRSRFGELRPDIWLRPANTPAPPPTPGLLVMRGPLDSDDVHDLVARLWSLDDVENRARRLHDALTERRTAIGAGRDTDLPETFTVAAAAVRFLRTEPQLPTELHPDVWTAPSLRPLYDSFSVAFQQQLSEFFARS